MNGIIRSKATAIALSLLMAATTSTLQAEEVKSEKSFSSKPIITLFESFHQGVGNVSDDRAFEHERGYLGYEIKAKSGGSEWKANVTFDIKEAEFNDSKNLVFSADLKSLQLDWKYDKWTLSGGIIKTNNYGLKESAWGYRYIMACFEANYSFAPSADLGLSAEYRLNSKLSFDLSLTNGKGHKKLTLADNHRYGAGVTAKPIKDLTLRAYYDLYDDGGAGRDQHSASLFAGYRLKSVSMGVEYNYVLNRDFSQGSNIGGGSIFATYFINDKFNIFGRYDLRTSTDSDLFESGNTMRGGVEYRPLKFLRISPNVLCEQVGNSRYSTYLYLNLMVKI